MIAKVPATLRCDDGDCRSSGDLVMRRQNKGRDLRRRQLKVRKLNPYLQTTRTSPIFHDVAVAAAAAAALKASRMISIISDLTFPSSIVNSKACTFIGFPVIWDGGSSPKHRNSFSGNMAMVVVAAVIGDLRCPQRTTSENRSTSVIGSSSIKRGGPPSERDPNFSLNSHAVILPKRRSELRQGRKILIAGLNQKAAGEESVAGEDNDHGELKEAGVRGMASDAEQMPTRKIAILDSDSRDLGSIGMVATTTFLAWGENDDSPVRGGRERVRKRN
ncbi:hypothetical protein TIFTF001_028285 [Ficus carica]|uniref:Uncharacterized protein n=1 Tax=Ficus carica TaxID=3494 RepID=A0AA88DQP8_FICCA|nr:hypothetical protein TIFTF001_028285 [Ficus carica]